MTSELPDLEGLNTTEYWWLMEMLRESNYKIENSNGFAQAFSMTVVLENGDRYFINEFNEELSHVKKLERKDNV